MADSTSQPSPAVSVAWPLLWTAAPAIALVGFLVLTARIEEGRPIGFLAPYKDYVVITLLALFGIPAVENGSKSLFVIAQRRISSDVAGALRIIARVVAYGIILSTVVSVLTSNAAAALTMGSFAGLVAGFASQTVMGNALAGLFMAVARPIRVADRVTISGNTGTVIRITLMHTVLNAEDREILIPSSNIVNAVLVRHKSSD